MTEVNVLFVCTGNVFRSLSAEFLLRRHFEVTLEIAPEIFCISSAGTVAQTPKVPSAVETELAIRGIDIRAHQPRKITHGLAVRQHVIVAMSTDHRDYISAVLGMESVLFNQLACGKDSPILDVHEVDGAASQTREEKVAYMRQVIGYIEEAIPAVGDRILEKYHELCRPL